MRRSTGWGSGTRRASSRWVLELATLGPVRDGVVVAILLAAAVALSAPALGPTSLWLDDAWIAMVHRVSELGDVLDIGLTAPGFALLLKGWFALVGFSETAAQALPFVAGVAVPPVVYLVGRRIGLGAVAAGFAATILLLSPVRVEYAGRVKPFTIDALAAALLVWLAWRTAEDPGDDRRWAVLVVAAFAATLVSTSSVVVGGAVVGGAAIAAWRTPDWGRARRWTVGYVVATGAWILVFVAPNIHPALREYWAGRYVEGVDDLWRVLRSFASDLAALEHAGAVAVLSVLLALAFVAAARRRLWQAAILVGPLVGALVLAVAGRVPLGTGRTDLYLYPTMVLAVAWSLHHLPWRPWPAVLALVGVVAVGIAPPTAGYPAEEFAPLTDVLEDEVAEDDLVLLTASTVYGVALYGPWTDGVEPAETSTGFTPVFGDDRIRRAPGQNELDRMPELLREVPHGADVWLFTSRTSDEAGEDYRGALEEAGWRVEERWTAQGATLERWMRAAP